MLPKDSITAKIHKSDCANDCGVRAVSVSLEAQTLTWQCIEINPQIKHKVVLGKICKCA